MINALNRLRAIVELQGFRVGFQKIKEGVRTEVHYAQENTVVPVIRRLTREKAYSTYVDVGAYDGDTVLPVVNLFRQSLAIEPTPASFTQLRRNLDISRTKNCVAFNCALGERVGHATVYYSERQANNSTFERLISSPQTTVEMTTLDTIVEQSKAVPPFLIKVDVEGSEFEVAKGGLSTLQSECAVLTEFWPYALRRTGGIYKYPQLLKELGFGVFTLLGDTIGWPKLRKWGETYERFPHVATSVVCLRQE